MMVTSKAKNTGRNGQGDRPPFDIILPRLELFCFAGKVCEFLQGDLDFRRLEFQCQQFGFMKNITESRYNIPVSINALTRAFDCPLFRVQMALVHELDNPGQRGKHITLDQDREQQILDCLRQNAERRMQNAECGKRHRSHDRRNH
jgi:hypothetical protein